MIQNLALDYVVILMVLRRLKLTSAHGFILSIVPFWAILLVSTYLKYGKIKEYYTVAKTVATFVLFTGTAMEHKKTAFIDACCLLFGSYTIINLATVLLFPNGLYQSYTMNGTLRSEASYFLGHKNNVYVYMLPALICTGYRDLAKNNRFSLISFFLTLSILLCCIIGKSLTSLLAFSAVLLCLLWPGNPLFSKLVNTWTGLAANIAFFVCFILMRLQSLFSPILEYFGKGTSMNGRERIWNRALLAIINSPIIGHGVEPASVVMLRNKLNNDSFHNLFLDYLYQGGIVGLILFLLPMTVLAINIRQVQNTRIRNFFNAVIFSGTVIWMAQPTSRTRVMTVYLPILLILCFTRTEKLKQKGISDDSAETPQKDTYSSIGTYQKNRAIRRTKT